MKYCKSMLPADYAQWLTLLKQRIAGTRQRVVLSANAEQIHLYHDIGREILDRQTRQGWGAKVIDRLAADLQETFPDMKGLSSRNLKYMCFFARCCPDLLIGQQTAAQLPWFHIVTILTKLSEPALREWYAANAANNAWSRDTLDAQIKGQLHLREGAAITNFKKRLPAPQADLAAVILKDPYHFDFLGLAKKPKNATSRMPSSATLPASCWNSAQASPSLDASTDWWSMAKSSLSI